MQNILKFNNYNFLYIDIMLLYNVFKLLNRFVQSNSI